MSLLKPLSFEDDRGHTRAETSVHLTKGGRWLSRQSWLAVILFIPPVGGILINFFCIPGKSFRGLSEVLVSFLSLALISTIAFVLMRRDLQRRASANGRERWARIAMIAAHRYCGGCGYSLAGAEPQADGCAVCPECGSAWHRDRWVFEGQDPAKIDTRPRFRLLSSVGASFDDFGVPAPKPRRWRQPWAESSRVPLVVRQALSQKLIRLGFQRFTVSLGLTYAGLLILLVLFDIWESPNASERTTIQSTTLAAGLATMLLGSLYFHIVVSPQTCQDTCLIAGRCPACGELLPVEPIGFNSCIRCPACPHAWKANRIGRSPLTPRSSP